MSISQTLNYPFLSHPEKRQGNNAIITFEETKVFEIENASFLSILKLYKTRDWGEVVDTNLYKKNNNFEIHLALLHFLPIYFGRTCTDSNCSESLQKVKHNIVNTCNYPYCDALWKLYIVCIRFHQLFEMSWCIYWKVQLLVVLVNWQ